MGGDRQKHMRFLAGVAVAGAILGLIVVRQPMVAIVLAVGFIAIWAALNRRARPVLVGLLVLAYLNAIPFIDLVAIRLPASIRFDDVTMAALVGLGLVLTRGEDRRSPIGLLRLIILITFGYWTVVLAYTVLTGAGTLMLSALYGRDLLAMSIALAVAGTSRTERDAELLLGVLAAGASLYALAHLLQFTMGVDTSAITHPYMTGESLGTSRIFSRAMSLIPPMLVLAAGRATISDQGPKRFLYWGATALLVGEIVIEFTRANYVGMTVAFIIGAAIIIRTRAERPETRAAIALLSAAFTGLAVWLASGSAEIRSRVLGSAITSRFTSTSSELAAQAGTLGYRLQLYRTMLGVLGDRFIIGVGFLHPAESYVSVLPQGSVRNNDTGMLGVLMSMGLIGILLFLWPMVLCARWAWRSLSSSAPWVRATGWSMIGYTVWALLTAFSLGFLSQGSGLGATSVAVGLMASAYSADLALRGEGE